jgi:formate hydrogenlyase subunit 3/multisubunit Na+/H+ antiporter MnhD subunit
MFVVAPGSAMSIVLMAMGSLTIIASASMALIEKNLFKMLGYSTVSQVGYMVLGIGTGSPIGLVGALFHMFNNTIYKTALFFEAGAVELKTKQSDLDNLGGLAKLMPLTFVATLISAFSISGIPPLAGFFSKWLIYQSLIAGLNNQSWYIIIFVILAMLGSVFTLAYFLKLLYSVFLRPSSIDHGPLTEVSWTAWLPGIVLAIITILAGIFAQVLLRNFFAPIQGADAGNLEYGFFSPGLTTILVLLGIVIGIVIYFLTRNRKVRTSEVFTGGELAQEKEGVSGTEFYDSVKKIKFMSETYRVADKKYFDLFEQSRKLVSGLVSVGRKIHNGLLQTYLGWLLLGIIAIIVTFLIILLK